MTSKFIKAYIQGQTTFKTCLKVVNIAQCEPKTEGLRFVFLENLQNSFDRVPLLRKETKRKY